MTAITITQHKPRPPWALFFLLATVCGVIVTAHALAGHKTEVWTSTRVLERLQYYNQNKTGCQNIEIVSCPNAANHIKDSPNFGRAVPQFRAYCGQTANYGLVGIFALSIAPPYVYVTGYALDYSRWQSINMRDACVPIANWWLGRLLQ